MVHVELTVAAVARRDSRYLVIEEIANAARVINQPAGHVEPGERILDAVVRETREESAWGFTPTGLVGLYYWPHDDGRTTLRIAICGDVDDHAPDQPLDDGILAAHWLSRDELALRNDMRSPLVLQTIDDFEAREPMSLDRLRHIQA